MTTGRGYLVLIGLLLLWNLTGIAAFVSQFFMDSEMLAALPPAERKLFAEMPGWAWLAYAVEVFGSVAGTLAMLLKRRLAITLYAISLLAVILQLSHPFLSHDLCAAIEIDTTALPVAILMMAIVQLLFALRMAGRGVLR